MNLQKKQGAGRPKSEEKKNQILQAASCLFMECGFIATSMDMVANRANVSKQTVYSHFNNKDALYVAVIAGKCAQYSFGDEMVCFDTNNIQGSLVHLGNQFVKLMLDPEVIATYKTLIGDTNNNRHVAELFYDTGAKQGLQMLINFFLKQQSYPISKEVAWHLAIMFFNTLKGEYHYKNLLGVESNISESELEKFVVKTSEWITVCLKYESQSLNS